MSPGFLNLALLSLFLGLAACSEGALEVKAVLGADCALPCTAVYQSGVQYRAVRWYKVRDPPSPRLSGLVTRDLPNGMTQWYTAVEREVKLQVESSDIILPNVTCADRGVYSCHLAAPVGEQNRDGLVVLTVTDCPDAPTQVPATDAYMVIVAVAVLVLALAVFVISYACLKNTLRDRNKMVIKETLLEASLKPLDKKDLMLIYTLGPKPTMKHVCV